VWCSGGHTEEVHFYRQNSQSTPTRFFPLTSSIDWYYRHDDNALPFPAEPGCSETRSSANGTPACDDGIILQQRQLRISNPAIHVQPEQCQFSQIQIKNKCGYLTYL